MIKGTFNVVGTSPDGDSVRFKADNKANWQKLERKPKLNKKDFVQLRFEAIDALETHYSKSSLNVKQPEKYAKEALDFMLAELGIKNVVWTPSGKTIKSADDGTKGYILTRTCDPTQSRRPIAFVFAGDINKTDDDEVYLTRAWVKKSVNYKLAKKGLVYPMFYRTLFWDLREEFSAAVQEARQQGLDLWPYDKSSGVTVNALADITDKQPIFPKLFRRIIEHWGIQGSLQGFIAFLEAKDERLIVLPESHSTHFDTVIEVDNNKVKLTVLPENLVFDE